MNNHATPKNLTKFRSLKKAKLESDRLDALYPNYYFVWQAWDMNGKTQYWTLTPISRVTGNAQQEISPTSPFILGTI